MSRARFYLCTDLLLFTTVVVRVTYSSRFEVNVVTAKITTMSSDTLNSYRQKIANKIPFTSFLSEDVHQDNS